MFLFDVTTCPGIPEESREALLCRSVSSPRLPLTIERKTALHVSIQTTMDRLKWSLLLQSWNGCYTFFS